MLDDVMKAAHDCMQEIMRYSESLFDSFLDELSPEEQRRYARLGVVFALSELEKHIDMEE